MLRSTALLLRRRKKALVKLASLYLLMNGSRLDLVNESQVLTFIVMLQSLPQSCLVVCISVRNGIEKVRQPLKISRAVWADATK